MLEFQYQNSQRSWIGINKCVNLLTKDKHDTFSKERFNFQNFFIFEKGKIV